MNVYDSMYCLTPLLKWGEIVQMRMSCWLLFFFFQAEDGIRDLTVTGVQTCALPIFTPAPQRPREGGSVLPEVLGGQPPHGAIDHRIGEPCLEGSRDRVPHRLLEIDRKSVV